MAPRGRKYSAAAPAEVRAEVAEQKRRDESAGPTVPERHAWRMDLLRRAGAGMCQNPDRTWRPVALWLAKAVRASEQAWFFSNKEESAVLPGGELDYCCRVANAYITHHGPGSDEYRRSDHCPEEFRIRERKSRSVWANKEG